MSVLFNWAKLDRAFAMVVEDLLNREFAALSKPEFIGSIAISDLSFGTKPPNLEVIDLGVPTTPFVEACDYKITDCQVLLRFSYGGDMSFKVSTELKINYPSPLFMVLPLRFSLVGLSLNGLEASFAFNILGL